ILGVAGYDERDPIRLFDGNVSFRNLDLHDLKEEDGLGIIIDGDLHVDGAVVSRDESAAFLLVTGNVTAESVTSGGPDIAVLGDLTAEKYVLGTYNHGYLHVGGKIVSPYVIKNDHDIECEGG